MFCMVLVLTESDVSKVITMRDVVNIIENTFREYFLGRYVMPPRMRVLVPGMKGDLRIMPAALLESHAVGFKVISGSAGARNPSLTYFFIALYDPTEGNLLAIISGDTITRLRTGAASAVATKYLARRDSSVVGVYGSGVQARAQLEALSTVMSIRRALVYDVIRDKAVSFANDMSKKLGIDVHVVQEPKDASNADVIVTATTSTTPFLIPGWIKPGTHINAIGANSPSKSEVAPELFKIAKVVVDFKEQVLNEAGDLINAIKAGVITPNDIYAELGEIVGGAKRGRENDNEITLFKSVGVAIEDVAVANEVYKRAKELGIGREIDLTA